MPSKTIQAPVGGWNARDSLANMKSEDAVELVNIVPSAEAVITRPGQTAHSSSLSDLVETLVTYHGTTEALICAAGGKLIDISAGSTGTNLGTGFTSDRWQHAEFNQRIIFCNGSDPVQDWDGTTLTATALTGGDIVTNGAFAADTDWTKGTGWTIASNVAHHASGATSTLSQTPATALVDGESYSVTFTVSNVSGSQYCYVQLGSGTAGTHRTANGTYTETLVADTTTTDINIVAHSSFVGDIDNVTVTRLFTLGTLIFPCVHKGRLYYVEADTQKFWYAGAGAYTGALTVFDLGTVAGTGANLSFLVSWSRDGGSGMDDLLACVFEDGVVVVYAGSDPSDANDWSLVGVYKMAAPLGRRAAEKDGGDAVILTVDGYVRLGPALTEGIHSEQSAFSFRIEKAAKSAAQAYKSNFGWSSIYYAQKSLWLVNVPISSTQSQQHVKNTVTGKWCKFTDVNAVQFAIYNNQLYFGSQNGYVYKLSGASDNGNFINYKAVQAYNAFGDAGSKKKVSLVMAHTNSSFPRYFSHKFFADFNETSLPNVSDPPESAVSEWDVGAWDVATWDGSSTGTNTSRQNAHGNGYFLAHVFRFKSKAQTVTWWATQIILKKTGIL